MNGSEILREKKKNQNKNFESSYEICNADEIQEFYQTEFIDSSNEEFLPNKSLLKNKEYSIYLDKKKKNYENKLKMEKEISFQNEMLKNILISSQKMKEMQKELFKVDVQNFIPILPPESRNSYSIQREYTGMYDNINQCCQYNNYNNNKNINHNYYNKCESNIDTNEDIPRNYLSGNIEKCSESKLISYPSRIGEIKVNIDDIKKGLLSYYSNIFSLEQYDIEDRINILRYGEKNISDSLNIKYSYLKKEIPKNPQFLYYNSELNNPYSSIYQNIPPEYYYSYHSDKNTNYLKDDIVKSNENCYSEKTQNEKSVFEGNFDHQGQISELLNSLKNKCEDAKFRVEHLSSKFNKKYENPDNKFWIHNLVPPHLRKPGLNDEDDIRKHLVTVYAQLFNEAMLNKKKITALEKKLHILKLKSKIYKNQCKIETRNAL
ncbi:conserved Plasmodium protein, unknown function [Plasmodium gallinaceum]|uniref:Uncharacterized protein n=1 Tax=Plasmodium gallinaceum TaxID=5849 RepID=A0A1J1GVJ8_PLAGA|nr:conserved Plasmodium protein, unknown function [Plasmodium gallinaceum]CRG95314.1 conserved Plasmodium protein, unknown function [Plasmodium gallinaceum]